MMHPHIAILHFASPGTILHIGWLIWKRCDFMLNTLRPRHNWRHFADAIFKCIFLNENAWIPIKISLKFVPHGPINNISALVQIMAWRRPGDKPLSGPMMVRLPMHICITRPQWVKLLSPTVPFQHKHTIWTCSGRDKMAAVFQTIFWNAFS